MGGERREREERGGSEHAFELTSSKRKTCEDERKVKFCVRATHLIWCYEVGRLS